MQDRKSPSPVRSKGFDVISLPRLNQFSRFESNDAKTDFEYQLALKARRDKINEVN